MDNPNPLLEDAPNNLLRAVGDQTVVFQDGDYVRITCDDDATFEGVLTIHDHYILLDDLGFAIDHIDVMTHWSP